MSEPLSKMDNQQGHRSLIKGFGRYFAAQAWEGYIHYKQRGAMVMILPEVKVLEGTPPLYEASLKYAPEGSDLLKRLGFWPHEDMEQILREYTPESQVVCIVVGLNRMAHCYQWDVPENLSPPKAYKEWRERHPIGIRMASRFSLEESLDLYIRHSIGTKKALLAQQRRISSDVAYAATYLDSLIKDQAALRADLEAGGIGIGADGLAYPTEPASLPKNSLERFFFNAKIIDYLAMTAALNQALKAYEASNLDTADKLKEVALVADKAHQDMMTRLLVAHSSPDFTNAIELADDAEEIQKIFLLVAAARLRLNLKQFPRLRAALKAEAKAEGQPVNKILLRKILSTA